MPCSYFSVRATHSGLSLGILYHRYPFSVQLQPMRRTTNGRSGGGKRHGTTHRSKKNNHTDGSKNYSNIHHTRSSFGKRPRCFQPPYFLNMYEIFCFCSNMMRVELNSRIFPNHLPKAHLQYSSHEKRRAFSAVTEL